MLLRFGAALFLMFFIWVVYSMGYVAGECSRAEEKGEQDERL